MNEGKIIKYVVWNKEINICFVFKGMIRFEIEFIGNGVIDKESEEVKSWIFLIYYKEVW